MGHFHRKYTLVMISVVESWHIKPQQAHSRFLREFHSSPTLNRVKCTSTALKCSDLCGKINGN